MKYVKRKLGSREEYDQIRLIVNAPHNATVEMGVISDDLSCLPCASSFLYNNIETLKAFQKLSIQSNEPAI